MPRRSPSSLVSLPLLPFLLLLLLTGVGSALAQGDMFLVMPQLAVGDGWSSDVFITNQDSVSADNLALSFYGTGSGLPLLVSTNLGSGTSFQFNLEGGGSKVVKVSMPGPLKVGYATLRFPAGVSVRVTLIVRWRTTGGTVTQLGVPGQTPTQNFSFPVEYDPANQVSMGVALALPTLGAASASSRNVVVSLIDLNGGLFRTAVVNLESGGHLARMLNESELFPGLGQFAGNVVVSCPVAFNALALRVEGTVLGAVAVNSGPIVRPFMVGTGPVDESEPNNTGPQAMPLTAATRVSCTFGSPGDIDYFSFTGKSGDIITALTDTRGLGSSADTLLALLGPGGAILAANEQNGLLFSNDSFLQAVLPQDGTYNLRVEEGANQGGASFRYNLHFRASGSAGAGKPSLSLLAPDRAYPGDSFYLSIYGQNLGGVTGISFAPSTGVQISGNLQTSPTQVTALVTLAGDAPTGTRQVTVSSPAGTSASLSFSIQPRTLSVPSISSLTPNSAVEGTSFDLVVTGTNLGDATRVNFSPDAGVAVFGISERSASQVKVFVMQTSATPGVRQVSVTSPGGTSNQLPFTILATPPNPVLVSITPDTFALGTTVDVTITGSSLEGVSPLHLSNDDGITVSNQQITSTQITARFQIATGVTPGRRTLWVARGAVSNALPFTIVTASTPGKTPGISNLVVGAPVFGSSYVDIAISFSFTDPDGDIRYVQGDLNSSARLLFTGPCVHSIWGGFLNRQGQTSGAISATLRLFTYSTGNYTVNLQLIDASGNGSNTLTFTTTVWLCQAWSTERLGQRESAAQTPWLEWPTTPSPAGLPNLFGAPATACRYQVRLSGEAPLLPGPGSA